MSSSGSLATLSLVAAIVFAGCTRSSDKRAATERYVSWYVEQQSGDAALARRLSNDLSAGWDAFLRLKREGRTSRDVADELKQMGYDVFLVGRGMNQRELPGQSVRLGRTGSSLFSLMPQPAQRSMWM